MKLHQKSILIPLTESQSNQLFNYLQSRPTSDTKSLQHLLDNALAVEDGTYHDQKLHQIETRVSENQRALDTIVALIKSTNEGLASLNDIKTDQISDTDLFITDTTQSTADKNA